jgi:Domain of unknown function (DUF5615)
VRGILADKNVEKHVTLLVGNLRSGPLGELWDALGLGATSIPEQGLPDNIADRALWEYCQQAGWVLVTDNRNEDGAESLEAVIRENAGGPWLPVVTIGRSFELLRSPNYRSRVAEDLIEALFDIEKFRGVGRLYLPHRRDGS